MRETRKFNLWVKYFTDPNEKDTYGNATKSAVRAYGYTSPDKYHLASVTGSKNMRKYEFLASTICDQEGFTFKELMKIGIKKMLDGDFNNWERFMIRLGYFSEHPNNQINIQNSIGFPINLCKAISVSRKARGLE